MSTIEVPVGIVCACLPAIRSLLGVVFPRAFATPGHRALNNPRPRSDDSKSASSKHYLFHRERRLPNDFITETQSNEIGIRQEWTVLTDPASERNDHSGGRESDVELVGVGIATPTHVSREASCSTSLPTSNTRVEAISSAHPEIPWDGTMGNGTGNGTGRAF